MTLHSGYDSKKEVYCIALEIARKIYYSKNQYVKILIMGATGRGKSYCALTLAWGIALCFSYFKYKNYEHWQEFLNLEENMAVASKKQMIKIKNEKLNPLSVIIFDEIQKGHNARDFREDSSRELLDLFQVKRTKRFVLIGTIQEHFAQDKQARNLYDYFIDMGSIDCFEHNVNFCKVFRGRLKPRQPSSKSVQFHYPNDNRTRWAMCAVGHPPLPIAARYEELREKGLEDAEREKKELPESDKFTDGNSITASDRLFDWLHDNPWILEKQPNGKYCSSDYIVTEFTSNTNEQISASTARPIIKKVRRETKT
jgi:hypothetical protein